MALNQPPHSLTATVLGAGTMGAGIAAHLAAAGCRTHLLDIVPPQGERSGIAQRAIQLLPKSRPPALMSRSVLSRLLPGNLEDDLVRAVGESDLVIEAVVERLDVKQQLFQRVVAAAADHTILATNTSGIGIDDIAQALPEAGRERFLGLHFFNPPRFMHLLEVIPGSKTRPEVVEDATRFCDRVLGKGTVPCRDTPNFIGNRVGIVEMLLTFHAAQRLELSVEEVDFLNGPLMGRPKTGSFRLGDLVGIDVIAHVVRNLERGLSADPSSTAYDPLYDLMKVPPVVEALVARGTLGDKCGAGFYKKTKDADGRTAILSLDLATLEYRPRKEAQFDELTALLKLPLGERLERVLAAEGVAGEFLREVYVPLFNYSAQLAGVICDSPAEIDDAMRWGYGWQLGPLEMVDAVGATWLSERLEARNIPPAAAISALASPSTDDAPRSFYDPPRDHVFVLERGWTPRREPEGALFLSKLGQDAILARNDSARLVDLGDGVACLEFLSKANVLDAGVVSLIERAPQLLSERGFLGLVLGNQAEHFCRGANLLEIATLIQKGDFDGVEAAVLALQRAFMGLRHGPLPVVAAPLGQTLGGGTEACLHCAEIQAGADTFMGLVELGVGLLPAGGGLKEIARRASAWAAQVPDQDPYPWVRRGFEAVASAKVSGSALEAREVGYLAASDGVTFHRSRVIADAKARALALATRGWVPPPVDEPISVIGARGGANLLMGVQQFQWGEYASPHDAMIGHKIVHVLSGGMGAPTVRTAWQLLDLEREAFVSLCGEAKTQQRIEHMLRTKRPLRN